MFDDVECWSYVWILVFEYVIVICMFLKVHVYHEILHLHLSENIFIMKITETCVFVEEAP